MPRNAAAIFPFLMGVILYLTYLRTGFTTDLVFPAVSLYVIGVMLVLTYRSYPSVGFTSKVLFIIFMPALVPVMVVAQVLMGLMIGGLMYTEINVRR